MRKSSVLILEKLKSIMVLGVLRGGKKRKEKENKWIWNEKIGEKFCYLGYSVKNNNNDREHVKN